MQQIDDIALNDFHVLFFTSGISKTNSYINWERMSLGDVETNQQFLYINGKERYTDVYNIMCKFYKQKILEYTQAGHTLDKFNVISYVFCAN